MPKRKWKFYVTRDAVADVIGANVNTVAYYIKKGKLDLKDLYSVSRFIVYWKMRSYFQICDDENEDI